MLKLFGVLFLLFVLYIAFGFVLELARIKREGMKDTRFDISYVKRILFWPKQIL
jgi:hypothetical protein